MSWHSAIRSRWARTTGRNELSRARAPLGRYAAALFVASAVLFSTPAGGLLHSAAGAVTPPVACPGGVSQCVTITIPSSCTSSCPTVTVGPTTNVGNGEYVYLSMQNFPPTDSVRIAFCPITNPPTIVPGGDPQCAYGLDPEQVIVNPIVVPVTPAGTVGASYPTQFDASGQGNKPIGASPIISNNNPKTPFFCDNGPDYCGIEVEDLPGGNLATTESMSNTAIAPITFATIGSGCPKTDPLVSSDSAYSLEHFLPAAVDATCSKDSGVSDLNTANNTGQVVNSLVSGNTPLVFTDEPQNATEQSELAKLKVRYIPVAVSATVVAFLAGDYNSSASQPYPVSAYNLTPNMVAGLISSGYSQGYNSDLIMPPLVCKQIYLCGTKPGDTTTPANYDTFDFLNPVPSGVNGPQAYGMFFSSTESGSSYQVTDWLCSAPNPPFTVTVNLKVNRKPVPTPVQVTDQNTASKTLTTAPPAGIAWPPVNDPSAKWPYPTCNPYPTLPVLAASTGQYSFDSTPALQAYRIRGYAYNGGAQPPPGSRTLAGFGAMDWSEAAYFGLNSSSMQNAAGNFVAPSQASIDAALADATSGSNGVLKYNYSNPSDAAAYPMPLVTYAAVSTSASLSAASAQAEGDLLTNLVCYSHAGGSLALPAGYVPLPDSLYNTARAEISAAFPNTEKTCNGPTPRLPSSPGGSKGPGHKGPGGSPGSTGSKGSSGSGYSSGQPKVTTNIRLRLGVTPTTAVPAVTASGGTHITRSTTPTGTTPTPASKGPGRGFAPTILALAEGTERFILAGLGGAALLGLIVGPLVVLAPRARRKLLRAHSKA